MGNTLKTENNLMSDAAPLSRLEVQEALQISNKEAVAATVHATLSGGAFQTGFALFLGASSFWVGVLSSFPTFAGLSQIFSSLLVERRGERRMFTAIFSAVGRLLWLPILLIPFLLPAAIRFPAFVILLLVASISLSMSGPAFTSWISDLVPPEQRGRYFGRRNMLIGLTTTVVSLPAAWFLDLAVKYHRFPESLGFAGLFAVAVGGGIMSYLLLIRQAEPKMQISADLPAFTLNGIKEFYRAPFEDQSFRRLMFFNAIFAAAQFFAAPFYVVYALQELKLNYVWIQVFATIAGISGMLAMPFWGHLSDKYGNRPVLAISAFGVCLLPIFWVFTSRSMPGVSLALIFTNNTLAGIFWAGVGLAQFNMLIGSTPNERKSVYVGAMSAVTGLAGGIAPIVGGALLTALEPAKLIILSHTFGHFQIIFLLNSLFRFGNLFAFRRVEDPGATSARSVLSQLSTAGVSTWVQMHRLQNASNEEGKMRAAHALRSAGNALAVEELIIALDDPSHHVREEATEALGEIGDARAIPALRDHLLDPSSGIVGECAEAIGRIGDPEGIEPLSHLLHEGVVQDRIVAAKALGRIGTEEALAELIIILNNPTNVPDAILEACLRGLSAEETPKNVAVIERYLNHVARGTRLAAIRAAGDLCSAALAGPLRDQLLHEKDESVVPQIAVSLAMTGDPSGVVLLLQSLKRVESPIAYKQILNAIGIVLGVEDVFYPFLSAEATERDDVLLKMVREVGKKISANDSSTIHGLRIQVRIDRAISLIAQEDFNNALRQISKIPEIDSSGPHKEIFHAILSDSENRDISQAEFALAILATNTD